MLVREDLDRLLSRGAGPGENIISELVSTVTSWWSRSRWRPSRATFWMAGGCYERRGGWGGMRNGYEAGTIRTAEGAVDVPLPQVRDAGEPFRSTPMGFLEGNSDVLEDLVAEMYACGFSTRDVEDAFRDTTGRLLISKPAGSEITDRL